MEPLSLWVLLFVFGGVGFDMGVKHADQTCKTSHITQSK